MKNLKSYFQFHKNDRNGILFLLVLIAVLQLIYVFVNFAPPTNNFNEEATVKLQKTLDSIQPLATTEKSKFKLFNPNYITDYKGAQLGMSVEEIDRLLAFRKTKRFVNSAEEFQQVTKVSDSLLSAIKPYFKFPDWVSADNSWVAKAIETQPEEGVKDINTATAKELQKVKGIGKVYANRIVNYRNKLGGYVVDDQLTEVWGLKRKTLEALFKQFRVVTVPAITKADINSASLDMLATAPYLNYETAKGIVAYRDSVTQIKSFKELSVVSGVTPKVVTRLPLYFYIKK